MQIHTVHNYRRANMRRLAETYGSVKNLAKELGYTNSSFIVQMIGPNPIRQVSEDTARKTESLLDLVPGSLDAPTEIAPGDGVDPKAVQARQVNHYRKGKGLTPLVIDEAHHYSAGDVATFGPEIMDAAQKSAIVAMTATVAMVGKACDEVGTTLPTSKFANIIAMALLAGVGRTPVEKELYVKQLVELAS